MKVAFTVTVGRSGSDHLARLLNSFGIDCVAEHEPPVLLLARLDNLPLLRQTRLFASQGRLGQIGRGLQRRYLFTDEMMGRGKAYEWLEQGQHDKLKDIATRKVARIQHFARRGKAYVEVSQYFIKTYADYIHELLPDISLIKLTRHPLEAARSLANRNKELSVGGPPPDWRQNILRVEDWQTLSRFQIFLLRWLETEARFEHFAARKKLRCVSRIATERLDSPEDVAALFDSLGIHHRPIHSLPHTNANKTPTVIDAREYVEFETLLQRLDRQELSKIAALRNYPDLSEFI